MYGDYYYKEEAAEELGLRLNQLLGRLHSYPTFKALFEIIYIEKTTKRGKKAPFKYLMIHEDNLEIAKDFEPKNANGHTCHSRYGWNESAIECKDLSGNCLVCSAYPIMGDNCKMKYRVKRLLEEDAERKNNGAERGIQQST